MAMISVAMYSFTMEQGSEQPAIALTPKQTFFGRTTAVSTLFGSVYTALNIGMAIVQKRNPVAMLPILYNLTGYLPGIVGDALQRARLNLPLEFDTTMFTKIIATGVVEAFMAIAEQHPDVLGLGKNQKALHVVSVIGWNVIASIIIDAMTNAILRKANGLPTIYSSHSPETAPDSIRYICSIDYTIAQFCRLSCTGRQKNTGEDAVSEMELMADVDVENSENAAFTQSTGTASNQELFSGKKTLISAGLFGAYILLNSTMAFMQRDNPASMFPIVYNITGYLPRAIGNMVQAIYLDKPWELDPTMHTKIVGAAVIESTMLAATRYPEAMKLQASDQVTFVSSVIGWASLSSVLVSMITNAIQRMLDGSSLIYIKPSHEALSVPHRFLSIEYALVQAYLLFIDKLAPKINSALEQIRLPRSRPAIDRLNEFIALTPIHRESRFSRSR
jgi:hypothetical protein